MILTLLTHLKTLSSQTPHISSTLPKPPPPKTNMATLHFNPSLSFTLSKPKNHPHHPSLHLSLRSHSGSRRPSSTVVRSHKVFIEHKGQTTELEVDPDETILSKALEIGLSVPHDCKLGVCMTCPAKLLSGKVDQSEGMLSDDVVESGYALLCASYPRSDCHIRTIPEDELLAMQLATAND